MFNSADCRERIKASMKQLDAAFVDRTDVVRLIALANLVGQDFLLIGPHGTAKTKLIELWNKHIAGASFLKVPCGSFTPVEELFGPFDVKAFQSGTYKRVTDGKLPTVELAFLDEVMKLNDGSMNHLLECLNERTFHGIPISLWCVGAATNWPEVKRRSDKVEALYDRFVLRIAIPRIVDQKKRAAILKQARSLKQYVPQATFTVAELRSARAEIDKVEISDGIRKALVDIITRLSKEQIDISERRSNQIQDVLAASAWLAGRTEVTLTDFDVLSFGFWIDEPHIETLDSILDTIDLKVVKKCIETIDKSRQQYAAIKGSRQQTLQRGPAVMKAMESAAAFVLTSIKKEGITERGKSKIKESINLMKAELATLEA
ncbi:MAG: AAA family ATPase, partial [Pirellulaceae bacterium]|nr:AAA family ATPase [Pirellulaceae bacterium]